MSKSWSFRPQCSRDCQERERLERKRDRRMVRAGLSSFEGIPCFCWFMVDELV